MLQFLLYERQFKVLEKADIGSELGCSSRKLKRRDRSKKHRPIAQTLQVFHKSQHEDALEACGKLQSQIHHKPIESRKEKERRDRDRLE